MNVLRSHWYDIGIGIAAVIGVALFALKSHGLSLILWISLISLLLHQFEEYRYPGTFPGMINTVMFASIQPDRYPLNTNTALIVNVFVGWSAYLLAAIFGGMAVWMGIAAILLSVGNIVAHTFLFNMRGKTRYNPGMFTAVVLFFPLSGYFFYYLIADRLSSPVDWVVGIALGVALNYFGVWKMIDLMKNRDTAYVFPQRNLGTS